MSVALQRDWHDNVNQLYFNFLKKIEYIAMLNK